MENIWIESAISVAAAVLAVLAGILIERRLLKNKTRGRIRYLTRTAQYIHPMASEIPNLSITFGGDKCTGFNETRFALWNESSDVVSGVDMSPASPMSWHPPAGQSILQTRVIQQSNRGSNAKARIDSDSNSVLVWFDYLEPNDGFVVSVFHSGTEFLWSDPDISGSVKGFGIVSRKLGDPTQHGFFFGNTLKISPQWSRYIALLITVIASLSIVSVIPGFLRSQPREFFEFHNFIPALFVLMFLVVLGFSSVIAIYRGKPPESLSAFQTTWTSEDEGE